MTERQSPLWLIEDHYPSECAALSRVFADTTNSYKLFWLLALLSRLPSRPDDLVPIEEILLEMHVQAWHPVTLFRLSLGLQDKLQESVWKARAFSSLATASPLEKVRNDPHVREQSEVQKALARYVPFRFLSPWFAGELRGTKDSQRNAVIRSASIAHSGTSQAAPYSLPHSKGMPDCIKFDRHWHEFLARNRGLVEGFVRHALVVYIQARNPGVPGIVEKLDPPLTRELMLARRFWSKSIVRIRESGHDVRDLYSGLLLEDSFAIDHFLPWSFVAHDLGWNLCPVSRDTNSQKSDRLPSLDLHLPRLARLHHLALRATPGGDPYFQDHCEAFRQTFAALRELSPDALGQRFHDVVAPQMQIAANLGFERDWIYKSPALTANLKIS